ncbi:MAG: DeoR family transcriptional regulator [Chloroflexi bacterium]|nr:DeoR family transcriptional regulator [Chloroflexota bacterium]
MNNDEILSLYQQGQGATLAFEVEAVALNRLAETLAAFANADGGFVFLGIDSNTGLVRGIRDVDETIDKVLAAGLRCEPPLILPRPESAILEEKTIVIAEVTTGLAHAYSLRGKYLARSGKKNSALGPRQLRQLLRERGEANYEALPAPGATLDDLDNDLVQKYAAAFLGDSPIKKDAIIDLLFRRGCITKDGTIWRPTTSGYLLFGKDPQRTIPSAEILLARYSGKQMTDEFVREVARGSLPEQIRRAEQWIVNNMRKGARIDSFKREDRAEYPPPAVREAIVNAVAHRDYAIRGDEIRVMMFSDRIEVYSPGRLPGHVTIDNIVEERFSRNEVIAQVLADLGFIERLGYGIDRMIRLMRDWGLPAPRFAETSNGFRVTLRGPGERLVGDEIDRSKWRRLDLNERQEATLEYIAKNQRVTNKDLRDLFPDVSEETIRRDLADLVEQDVLLKMGDKKGTHYILKQ